MNNYVWCLTFWHRSYTFNSNKSPTWCNSLLVYYPDVCLQLNKFRVFSLPSSGAQLLQWQSLVLPPYRGDSRAVFVVGLTGRLFIIGTYFKTTLNTFERKMLRRIYGPTHEVGCWRLRWNNELYILYNEPKIMEDIKIRRLEWAGNIRRMEEERFSKKVLNGNFHTTRTVGRPRNRWADVV